MALTRGTTAPIAPASGTGGGTRMSPCIMEFPCKASEAYRVGDIVVLASGAADAVDAGQADGAILGVALQAKTAPATAVFSNRIQIACAIPGAMFTGSFITGAATDFTANTAASIGTTGAVAYDTVLGTDAYTGYLMIDSADTTGGQCRVIRYSLAQFNGATFAYASTTIINPRVDFCFRSSVFLALS